MSQQYEAISERYDQVKQLPVGLAEQASLLAALPDVTGATVLDVGTGAGFYPRLFTRLGARRVVGVDASPAMITRARMIEKRDPRGIAYHVCDAVELPVLGEFDLVTAVWLLGYAEDEDILDRMLTNLAANLAAGARLVALVPNPDFDWDRVGGLRRYGLSVAATGVTRGRPGSSVTFHIDPPFTIEGYTWPPGVIEASLTRAGLTNVRRHAVSVPVDVQRGDDDAFWVDLLANPTFAVFSATRPGQPAVPTTSPAANA